MRLIAILSAAATALLSPSAHAAFDLRITEIYSGQENPDPTEDWFEVANLGDTDWVASRDGDLYYDDDSADPLVADLMSGIDFILPGQSVVYVNDADNSEFLTVWANVPGVRVGTFDGSGLGGSGDTVNLWVGDPTLNPVYTSASYPSVDDAVMNDATLDGASYDVFLGEFSTVGNDAGAVASVGLGGGGGGIFATTPSVGSPGSIPEPSAALMVLAALAGISATRTRS